MSEQDDEVLDFLLKLLFRFAIPFFVFTHFMAFLQACGVHWHPFGIRIL